jgi:myotubularin-related protein 3/4
MDTIQQRLRQIEAGHQMEVDMLKKQVQELWSRLESHHHAASLRINGDIGDEVVRPRLALQRENFSVNCRNKVDLSPNFPKLLDQTDNAEEFFCCCYICEK